MPSEWTTDENHALLTDLYQLTMLQAYFEEGMDEEATFDLFVRRIKQRNFLLAAGLDTILHYLETIRFTDAALTYLRSLDLFKESFLEYLAAFRFEGDVYAIREGTAFFPDEPVVQVVAPIGQAQLVETFLLNQITFQSGIASKAARVVHAAQGRTVADFGARRVHGADAANRAVRAYHIAGLDSTSNVLGGMMYGVDLAGTMAHSYIEAFDSEAEAFEAFARLYPSTTLLVDTYDTVQGVKRVVELRRRLGERFSVGAIRLDSGDLADLAKQSRRLLDEGGLGHVRIFASGSLDEYAIRALLADGAPIDGFGVGTRMGTMADRPYLDSAYKLTSYAGTPRMKLSSSKSNLPGLKQVFRHYDGDGSMLYDVIAAHDERLEGEPLVEPVMEKGRRTDAGRRTLNEARAHAAEEMRRLPEQLRELEPADAPYEVRISDRLETTRREVRDALAARSRS